MKNYQPCKNQKQVVINQKTDRRLLIDNVVLLKSEANYTTFYLESGGKKLVAHTIKYYEHFLAIHGFIRIHRSFIVNPLHIKGFNIEDDTLTMSNGFKATVSRRKKRIFRKNLSEKK
jgi:DNA-binding LytR/AlgR family response regulator